MGSAPSIPSESSSELRAQARVLDSKYTAYQEKINKLNTLEGQCHACLQDINPELRDTMLNVEIEQRDKIKGQVADLWAKIPETEKLEAEIKKYSQTKTSFERLNQLIDRKLATKTLDKSELGTKLNKLTLDINKINKERINAIEENKKRTAHNSKIDVIKKELEDMNKSLHTKNINLTEKENMSHLLELLKKTFGTNGLVSYKIESSVKELERKINSYLAELSHFQMYFRLQGEKLNLEIVDDKNNIMSIANLSSGERARLNLATVLAIRNILSSLTNTKINLLFLDEITGALDSDGKEKFTEILLQENMNTFFVSHEWSHPLVPVINITKEHGISRIET
jgi:DNA repair exonuclease SbcCD ATPase subunit